MNIVNNPIDRIMVVADYKVLKNIEMTLCTVEREEEKILKRNSFLFN